MTTMIIKTSILEQNLTSKQTRSPKPSGTTAKRITRDSPIKSSATTAGPFDSTIRNDPVLKKRNFTPNYSEMKLVIIGSEKVRYQLKKYTQSTGRIPKQQ